MRKNLRQLIIILFFTILFYLPIVVNNDFLWGRNNDLNQFFGPIYLFVRKQIIEHGVFPFWINSFLSGTPLLPDPQSPLFYLPNIIFLIFPINSGFLISIILHSFFGGLGMYFLGKKGLGLNKGISLWMAVLYISAPRLSGFIHAGHFGLIAASSWVPLFALGTIMITKKPNIQWAILQSIALVAIFLTHTTTFVISALLIPVIVILKSLIDKEHIVSSIKMLIVSYSVFFGLSAVTLLPQLYWAPITTRVFLLNDRSVYPQWNSILEFGRIIIFPLWDYKNKIGQIDTEKWITSGTVVTTLAILGLLGLRWKARIILGVLILGIAAVSLNNASPFYQFLLSQDWYVLGRVTTRVWFPLVIIFICLAGKLIANIKNNKLQIILMFLAVAESIALSWIFITKPISNKNTTLSIDTYKIFREDKGRYRIYCVDHCIPQYTAVEENLELVEGYSTLQQVNYYKHAWELTGSYWNYYTLAIPPFGVSEYSKPKPRVESLAEYNTKYIISPYTLDDRNLQLISQAKSGHFVYLNKLNYPRSYFIDEKRNFLGEAKILDYNSNHIKVDTSEKKSTKLVLSEVYSPGWKAYLNGTDKVDIQETPNVLRFIDISEQTKFVEFRYEPNGFVFGKYLTLLTLIFILLALINNKNNEAK